MTKRTDEEAAPLSPAVEEVLPVSLGAPVRKKDTVENWAGAKGTPDWLFAAARAHEGWGQGAQLTETQYDEVVKAVAALPIGYDLNPKQP